MRRKEAGMKSEDGKKVTSLYMQMIKRKAEKQGEKNKTMKS
jgi:hypothetical protein